MNVKTYTDQLGRAVEVAAHPQRIVSLVPSQTELLAWLELGSQVVGITRFCVHPSQWLKTKTVVGGTKTVDVQKVLSLKPDLVIANKEENERNQIEELARHVPVWVSDVCSLEQALQMITEVGALTGKLSQASALVAQISEGFATLLCGRRIRAVYLIWNKPVMAAGNDTFISDMMKHCGLVNVANGMNMRYPEANEATLKAWNPEVVLLSTEPYRFRHHHVKEFENRMPQAKVKLVDGQMFSWYGSRLIHAAGYFSELMNQLDRGE